MNKLNVCIIQQEGSDMETGQILDSSICHSLIDAHI